MVTRVHEDELEIILSSNSENNPFKKGFRRQKNLMPNHTYITDYCIDVLQNRDKFIVSNFKKDPSRDPHPDIDHHMNAYFGLPLYWPSGEQFGTIVVIDNKENGFSEQQQKLLFKLQQAILSDLTLITKMKELENSKIALCQLNDTMAEKSIILERQTKDLKTAKEIEEEANELKSKFLTNMSHELRTPLNAILGFSQLMQGNKKNPQSEKQNEFVSRIHSSGEHLLALINDILDLTTIEAGKVVLSLEKVAASDLFAECKELLAPMAREYGICIDFQDSNESLNLFCDFTRVKQVLLNLCSNGIKYNQKNGHLSIWAERFDTGTIRITVKDTGVGIPEDQHEKFFEAFNRLGKEDSSIEGTGIGMTITKKLVENMKGKLSFISKVGTGSEFYVDMPTG